MVKLKRLKIEANVLTDSDAPEEGNSENIIRMLKEKKRQSLKDKYEGLVGFEDDYSDKRANNKSLDSQEFLHMQFYTNEDG